MPSGPTWLIASTATLMAFSWTARGRTTGGRGDARRISAGTLASPGGSHSRPRKRHGLYQELSEHPPTTKFSFLLQICAAAPTGYKASPDETARTPQ
jgi:hypothetical protein